MNKKTSDWVLGTGFINNWNPQDRVIGFIPGIDYVENYFNKGVSITFLGFGFFLGFINKKRIDELDKEREDMSRGQY